MKNTPVPKLVLLFILAGCCSSCVTLFNRRNTHFYAKSDNKAAVVYHKAYEGVKVKGRRGIVQLEEGEPIPQLKRKGAYIIVKRNRDKNVPVTVRKDGVEKTVQIKPVHSAMYYANTLHLFPLLSFGYLIDRNNPNRFGYPWKVYIDVADTTGRYYKYYFPPKYIYRPRTAPYYDMDFAPPLANIVAYNYGHMQPAASPFTFSVAVNRHYRARRFLSVEAGAGFAQPLDAVFKPQTAREAKSAWYVNVKDNRSLWKFEFGYGLSVGAHNGRVYYDHHSGDSVVYRKSDFGVGGCLSANYRIFSYLSAGFSFQPQFVAFNKGPRLNYEYLANFGVKLRVGRRDKE